MLKKSELLEYILKAADKMKREDDKKALTANYFMISVLNLLKLKGEGKAPV